MLSMYRELYDADGAPPGGADKAFGEGQEPAPETTPDTPTSDTQPDGDSQDEVPEWMRKELEKARGEAAARRVKLRELEETLNELKPKAEKFDEYQEAQKTEEEKLREQIAKLEAAKAEAAQAAERAQAEAQLIKLAASAGVDPEIATLLDISKLDLEDEDATLKTLKKLSASKQPSGGGASNPKTDGQPSGPTEKDLVNEYFRPAGRGVGKAFGPYGG